MTLTPAAEARRAVNVLAVAAGISAANLYYAQPMVPRIASSLGCEVGTIGPALVLTPVGYALGMMLLVPLGDARERRGLIVAMTWLTAVSLLCVAFAPSPALLATFSLFMGLFTSIPQMAVPFAVGLVEPKEQPRAIGRVMAGVLTGILLSRTASGLLSEVFGWRAVYVTASALMVMLGLAMRSLLPLSPPPSRLKVLDILGSLGQVFLRDPVLKRHLVLGALGFAAFSIYWSTMAVELTDVGVSPKVIALFALVGVAGVFVSPLVGRVVHRTGAAPLNVLGLVGVSVSFGLLWLLRVHPLVAIPAVIVLDGGVQASHLANMAVLLTGAGERRSRINAVYMIGYFAGGGAGSAIGSLTWAKYGWAGVTAAGAGLALLGALLVLAPYGRSTGARRSLS